jgi:hypothetical protein
MHNQHPAPPLCRVSLGLWQQCHLGLRLLLLAPPLRQGQLLFVRAEALPASNA